MGKPTSALPTSGAPPHNADGSDTDILLAVDLDGTLLFTDTLFEALAQRLGKRPMWTISQMVQLPFAIAPVKARIQRGARVDVATLPVNEPVLAYCRRARDEGRKVWLVSAADQGIVSEVADRFGVFHRAIGSDGATNNKGANKGRLLAREAPQGFEYIGDSRADMKVWAMARAASVVGGGAPRRRAVERMGVRISETFERPSRGLVPWLQALRLDRCLRSLLIFAPAFVVMEIADPATLGILLAAALAICAVMASVNVVQALVDLDPDRKHPTRKTRPFAAGRLKLWQGFAAAPLLIVGGLIGGLVISQAFAALLLAYLLIALGYVYGLKRMAITTAAALGIMDTLLVAMGALLAGMAIDPAMTLLAVAAFFALELIARRFAGEQ